MACPHFDTHKLSGKFHQAKPPALSGYEVEHWLRITVRDPKKASSIYETGVTHGANLARGLEFRLANEPVYYQQALARAVHNAKEKALAIARALGLPLYDLPVELKEKPASPPAPYSQTAVAAFSKAPPIQTQDVAICAAVKAIFAYSFIS
ncbi:SIMPL domain-containing protein [Geobacillus sp. FSL W8-0032]|uniref:SIMPL domain-containing protein n=1 Tax=Geobacillus sp. FSL W8-0032 TaxID=2921730 RepID=UPI002286A6F6